MHEGIELMTRMLEEPIKGGDREVDLNVQCAVWKISYGKDDSK